MIFDVCALIWTKDQLVMALYSDNFFYLDIYLNIYPQRRVFCNVTLSNLGNVLQRDVRTDMARECIFRVFESTNFEDFQILTVSSFYIATLYAGLYQSLLKCLKS